MFNQHLLISLNRHMFIKHHLSYRRLSHMPKLLHIDSSPLYGRSVSRQLTDAFVTQWKSTHPNGTVLDSDLTSTPIPPINADWGGAVYTPEEARTPQQKQLLTLTDSLLAERDQADEYVFGVPK